MGGLKRKIPIEKKDSRAVTFSKRSKGLYSKASELCLLSDAQIAIIATPVSSNSNVSFYSFGHSSVDSVVAAFLANQRPREDLGLGFWWEDERLAKLEDPEELRNAMDTMSKMLQDLRKMHLDAVEKRGDREDVKEKKKNVLHGTHQKQTLNLQSSFASICIQDDLPENSDGFNKNTEEQVLAVSDNSSNNGLLGNLDGFGDELEGLLMNFEMDDVSMVTTNQNPFSDSEAVEDGELVMHRDLDEDNLHLSDFDDDQFPVISDNNNNNNVFPGNLLGEFNQELDLDEMIDFDTNCESLLMNLEKMDGVNDSDAVEDGGLVIHRDLDEDDLHFSDFFQ